MVIWIDGMEQAKFAIPRSRGLKTASALIRGCTYDFLGYQTHLSKSSMTQFQIQTQTFKPKLTNFFGVSNSSFYKIIYDSVSNTNSNFQVKAS